MYIAFLLLGGFVVFIVACLLIAARRGLWLMVEVDQRVHTERTVVHHRQVAHHHYLHRPDVVDRSHAYAEALPAARVVGSGARARTVFSRAVLPCRTPPHLPAHTSKESQ